MIAFVATIPVLFPNDSVVKKFCALPTLTAQTDAIKKADPLKGSAFLIAYFFR